MHETLSWFKDLEDHFRDAINEMDMSLVEIESKLSNLLEEVDDQTEAGGRQFKHLFIERETFD